MASTVVQTKTYLDPPQKQELLNEFVGKPLKALRTPAMVIDRHIFAQNCARMHEKAAQWGASFRAHLKTHKVNVARRDETIPTEEKYQTVEGTRLQLVTGADKTTAVVVSTLMEAWEVVRAGLVADGMVNDVSDLRSTKDLG